MEDNDFLDRSAEAAVDALASEVASRLTAPTEALFDQQLERIQHTLEQQRPAHRAQTSRRLEGILRETVAKMRRTSTAALSSLPTRIRQELASELADGRLELEQRNQAATDATKQAISDECDRLRDVQTDLVAHFNAMEKTLATALTTMEQRLTSAATSSEKMREELGTFQESLTHSLANWSEKLGTYVDGLGPRLEKQQEAFSKKTLLPEIERLIKSQDGGVKEEVAALREIVQRTDKRSTLILWGIALTILFAAAAFFVQVLN